MQDISAQFLHNNHPFLLKLSKQWEINHVELRAWGQEKLQHFSIDASPVSGVLTYQMDNAGSCQPDRDKYGDELCQSGAERHYRTGKSVSLTWYSCWSSKCSDTAEYLGKSLGEELSKISDQSMFFEGEIFCLIWGLRMYKMVYKRKK